MRKFLVSLVALVCLLPTAGRADEYRVGRATGDITLPVWGIQMLGYVHPQQVGQGLRQRLYARTFVIADAKDETRLAYVTCEVAFVTHTVKLAVLDGRVVNAQPEYDDAERAAKALGLAVKLVLARAAAAASVRLGESWGAAPSSTEVRAQPGPR